jgi:hypothetical protein
VAYYVANAFSLLVAKLHDGARPTEEIKAISSFSYNDDNLAASFADARPGVSSIPRGWVAGKTH